MRAVNLLPPDLRRVAAKPVPAARPEKVEGIGAYLVLGALALCVAAIAAYVMTTNTVEQKQSELAQVTADATVAAQAAAKLKPYADYEALANARVETVRGLAAARFDWEQALRDLSRALPADVKLQTLSGDMGLPGTTGTGSDPLRGSIQAPAITLAGCATSQPSVARMLSRLRGVDGATRVALSKSEKPDSDSESACAGDKPPSFSVVVFFERSAAMAAMAPAEANAATTPNVPTPSAVAGTSQPADGAAAPGTGTDEAPADGTSTTTSTSTPTSTTGADAP